MVLKALKIHGFKSFADPIEVHFPGRVTGIIGPNGCGKSNVVDAVRFVLGEQSLRLLRARKIDDLIFAGNVRRPQTSIGEVGLILDNSTKWLESEYPEIEIRRVIQRDGESKYFLNGVGVRLKDIQKMFMDVGVNKGHYSVIGQGQVQLIVSASPEERRQYFEEAAGVVSYRQSKKETLRRLEEVQRNTEQVEVFLGEYESRMHGLKVQAGRAEKYLEYKKSYNEWILAGSYQRYRQIRTDLDEIEKERTLLGGQIAELEHAAAWTTALEASLSEQRQTLLSEMSDWEARLQSAEGNRSDRDRILAASEEKWHGLRRDISQIDIAQAKLARTLLPDASPADFADRVEGLKREQAVSAEQVEEEVGRLTRELASTENEIQTLQARQSADHDDIISAHETFAALESTIASLVQNAEEIRARIEGMAAQAASDQARHEKLVEEKTRLEQARLAAGQAQTSSDLAAREAEGRMESSREKLMKLRAELAEVEGRLRSLSAAEESRQGFSAGVRGVLERYDKRDEFVGVVRDLIGFDASYTKAVEAALGPKLQHLVVTTGDTVKEILREMSGGLRGRVTFWALDLLPAPAAPRALPEKDNIVGWAVSLLKFDPKLDRLFSNLLGWTLVVKDMETLLAVAKETRGISIVTLDGAYYRGGAITAGPTIGTVLMGRKQELTEAESKMKDMVIQTAAEEEAFGRACSELSASRATSEAAFRRFKDNDAEHVRATAAFELLDRVMADRRNSMEVESAALSEKLTAVSEARARQAEAREQRGKFAEDARPRMEELRKDLERIRSDRESGMDRARALQEKQRDLARIESEFMDLAARRAGLGADIKSMETQMESLRAEFAAAQAEVVSAREGLSGRQKIVAEILTRMDECRAIGMKLSEELRHVGETNHGLDLRHTTLSAELANLKSNVQNDVQVDLDALAEAPPVPEGLQGLSPDDIAGRLRDIQLKIHKLGAVNVTAIDEYNEVAAKHADLQKQMTDLAQARDTLKDVLRKTDRICRDRFTEVFHRVAQNFEQVTKKLFLGGEGKLILTESEEVMESGVDIQLRPPGKGFTSLASRSGGEQSLAGLCLLFSLFMEKASPFCILDEVDAALDDSNVGRLVKLIEEFSQKIQFVIVTHNKLTMRSASCLFGATMEEAGITKLISVRMKNAEEAALAAAS